MALAAYGAPTHLPFFREHVRSGVDGGFQTDPIDWGSLCPPRVAESPWDERHAELAASVQRRLEEVELDLATWLHHRTGERSLAMAGGVALNCVANSRIWQDGPFERVWVQPAAGDAGTALGAAAYVAHSLGDRILPMTTAALGRGWSDVEIEDVLVRAAVPWERSNRPAPLVAEALERNETVAWFQGRSEWGPRALGHRSLLANPCHADNLERLNDIKGREQFRPVAPLVLAERADDIFEGPLPSPYMLFTHRVRPEWRARIPAVVHVDGTARIQTVHRDRDPLLAEVLEAFERRTGVPVLVNTSLNTRGRPMVDSPEDALECFGSSPIDVLAMGPFIMSRGTASARGVAA
jgi:carbamoyltransferase